MGQYRFSIYFIWQIAAFYKKIENYASLDRKRLNEKMLKDLSAKELEDDVNRNKI